MKPVDMRINSSKCLDCQSELSGATCISGDYKPSPKDITICFYCGSVMVFDDDLKFRRPDPNELAEITMNSGIQEAVFKIKKNAKERAS